MIEWLDVNIAYWHWIVFGVALAVLEMLMPSFFMLWLGASAITVGIALLIVPFSFAMQLFIWGALSVACLIAWFKFVSPQMKDKTRSGMAMEALHGKIGTVLDYQESKSRGQLRFPAPILGEDEWRFICETPLNPGDKVTVLDTSGNDLVVKPV